MNASETAEHAFAREGFAIQRRVAAGQALTCEVGSGGIVAMCPLMLHSSAPSDSPCHRRVIHIEFAADELPGGLEWF